MQKSIPKKKPSKRLVKVGIAIILIVLFDLSPFGGNIRYYIKWIECGTKPLVIASKPGGGVSWYEETNPFPTVLQTQIWYCTPLEAEQDGYSANEFSYDFPHLYPPKSKSE